ncbi:MAG: hypothetical protein CMJ18_12255 [Phycisphaeraceae bacterium]|nr:hypothetical protein [Phycisphaeraceae bacterium]
MTPEYRNRILFIDDAFLLEVHNLKRKVNPAIKHPEPVLKLDASWDTALSDTFNGVNVLYDPDERLFKMWYAVTGQVPGQYWEEGRKIAYATSRDGIHWNKPVLNILEVNGSTANNYIIGNMLSVVGSIILDPSDIPARRYKMIFAVEARESRWARYHSPLSLAYSADGIHWDRPVHVNPVIRGISDDVLRLIYDPDRRIYQLYTRRVPNLPRDISLYESYDLVNWQDMGRVLVADEHDGPEMYNLHEMTPFFYEDFCLGLLGTMQFLPGMENASVLQAPPPSWPYHVGLKGVQLCFTRDGRQWQRTEHRSPVIAPGSAGDLDEGMIFPAHAPIVRDGDTWIYYCACSCYHTQWSQQQYLAEHENDARGMNCCMLAVMPEDHWVSLDAGAREGWLLTKPYATPSRLLVNADAKGGTVEAEFVTPYGESVEGFTRADCMGISGNGKDQEIRWKTGTELRGLNEKHRGGLCLKLYLENAKLYSYSLMEPDPEGTIKAFWDNARWNEVIMHRSDNWGRNSNEPARGLPQPPGTQHASGVRSGPNPQARAKWS